MNTVFRSFLFAIWMLGLVTPALANRVTVFAAASLKTVLDDIVNQYATESEDQILVSLAASSSLTRQIQLGAPADLFISANSGWMDVLDDEGYLVDGTRINLVSNRLVLIGTEPLQLTLSPDLDLTGLLGDNRLAMALVDAVPAGIYGKAALKHLALWDDVASQVAQTDNVRAALRLVSMGEAPFGIVYATDAQADPNVYVLDKFDDEAHPPILYPAAILKDANEAAAQAFLDFLISDSATQIFRQHGFGIPDRAP